jgi:galactose mutarotase-like enzyme
MYHLYNDHLSIAVREQGAELTSIYHRATGIEHIWQADPAIWAWHAPVLFPVVGRCMDDMLRIGDKTYRMEKHGFARRATFTCIDQTAHSLTMQMTSSIETRAVYPYDFVFRIRYELDGLCQRQFFEVENTGIDTMYFALGGHPAFSAPFYAGERYEDYAIEFGADTQLDRYHIDAAGFFDGRTSAVLHDSHSLCLAPDMFDDDALIFKNLNSHQVKLCSSLHNHSLSVDFEGFSYLGLWAKPQAGYVCIEPWQGCAETAGERVDISAKEGIVALASGAQKNYRLAITIQ